MGNRLGFKAIDYSTNRLPFKAIDCSSNQLLIAELAVSDIMHILCVFPHVNPIVSLKTYL